MKHSGSRYKDFPSRRIRGLKPIFRQVAVAQTWQTVYGPKGEEEQRFMIETHGAAKTMIMRTVEPWCGMFFDSYTITEEQVPHHLNGRCYRSLVLTLHHFNVQFISADSFTEFFKNRMERLFLCRVTIFQNYDQFLNA